MINLLKNILNNQNLQEDKNNNKNLELLCGLMIEAAYTDGQIDENELNKIKLSLINVFAEDSKEVNSVLEQAKKIKITLILFTIIPHILIKILIMIRNFFLLKLYG